MNVFEKINLVKTELEKIPGKKTRGANYTMICCPFHNDNSPSGRISHNMSEPQFVGGFRCYACGDPMKWDVFATQTGLQPFSQVDELRVPDIPSDYMDEALLGADTTKFVQEDMTMYPLTSASVSRLGTEGTVWRGFKFSFLRSLGAEVCKITKNDYTNYYIYLPAMIHGNLRGYIKALPHKKDGRPSYFNASGGWSKKYGLWPFDFVKQMLVDIQGKTVVLVEGPRDAMRLIRDGIPALCILGTQSWSSHKVLLLETLEVTNVVLCFDGDEAGKTAAKLVYSGMRTKMDGEKVRLAAPLHQTFQVSHFDLSEYKTNPEDEDEKIDPCSAPDKAIRDLKANV